MSSVLLAAAEGFGVVELIHESMKVETKALLELTGPRGRSNKATEQMHLVLSSDRGII